MRKWAIVSVALLASVTVVGFCCADLALAKRAKTSTGKAAPRIGSSSGSITKAKPKLTATKTAPGKPGAAKPSTLSTRDRLRLMDRNRDGVVTSKEFTGAKTDFRRLDTNNDGKLTLSKAATAPSAKAPSGKTSTVRTPTDKSASPSKLSEKSTETEKSPSWVGRPLTVKSSAELD